MQPGHCCSPSGCGVAGRDKDSVRDCWCCSLLHGVGRCVLDAGVPLAFPSTVAPSAGTGLPRDCLRVAVVSRCSSRQGRGTPAAPFPAGVERLCRHRCLDCGSKGLDELFEVLQSGVQGQYCGCCGSTGPQQYCAWGCVCLAVHRCGEGMPIRNKQVGTGGFFVFQPVELDTVF